MAYVARLLEMEAMKEWGAAASENPEPSSKRIATPTLVWSKGASLRPPASKG